MEKQQVNWRDYAPAATSRVREATEWSITYSYRATATDLPRVLLIGDSICNAYQGRVRELLDGRVSVSFWASSKCVTDPDYFRELDLMLSARPLDMVTFNNGLHSLTTDRGEWDAAYAGAVSFLRAKLPSAKLALVLSTPLKDPALTAISASLNETAVRIAGEEGLETIDLFTPMDRLARDRYWTDTYHFTAEAVGMQAEILAGHILGTLGR
ncbi:MAG: SGNH/GDSL hydrolase family protein [Clostridia bacterium]|nr:SGNH/GDSL hydrolase family protein [Clostridia bacterium]